MAVARFLLTIRTTPSAYQCGGVAGTQRYIGNVVSTPPLCCQLKSPEKVVYSPTYMIMQQ